MVDAELSKEEKLEIENINLRGQLVQAEMSAIRNRMQVVVDDIIHAHGLDPSAHVIDLQKGQIVPKPQAVSDPPQEAKK